MSNSDAALVILPVFPTSVQHDLLAQILFLGLDSVKECYGLGGSDGKHFFLILLEV